jgi:pyruvate dehydrogenase E2 component (dihydrolipoamide acetyltransferase)
VAVEVLMPVITEEGEDGVVTAWMVDDGHRVTAGQLIAEVQAEKVAEEVRAPTSGVVRNLVAINQPVPQGQPICIIDEVAESEAADRAGAAAPAATSAEPDGGVVAASPAAEAADREPTMELTGLRAVIARRLRESHADTAPVTLTTTADVTGSLPPQITAWIVKVAAVALADHPHLNAIREGDRLHPASTAHISVAIQTDEGLVAPVVLDAAGRSISDIAAKLEELADRARSRRLEAADFEGGTFSVTNLGVYGIDAFTPIINPPQVAILGVGAVRTVPGLAAEGEVVPRRLLTLSLTFDHSFIDGAPAADFLQHVRRLLESGLD